MTNSGIKAEREIVRRNKKKRNAKWVIMVCSSFFTKFNDLINLSRISRSYSLFCFWFQNIVAPFDPSNLLRSLSHCTISSQRSRQVRLESRYNRIFNQHFRNVSSISFFFLFHLHSLLGLILSLQKLLNTYFVLSTQSYRCVSVFLDFLFSWLNLGFQFYRD